MKTLKFRVTATITKIIEVEVDVEGLLEDEIEDAGRQKAHEQFDCLNDGSEEKYTETSEIIIDF